MIEVKVLTKKFDHASAVDRVSFKIETPGITVIMGPSGCGKTTLLRLLAGLEMPDEGEVFLSDHLVSRRGWLVPPHLRNIGFVFQSPALWPHMTVRENILFGLANIDKKERKERLKDILKETDIEGLENRYPDEISGGQARRVALARSIVVKPRYLLMDEPLTNVNAELKDRLLYFIKEKVSQTTDYLLYVTHDAREAERISEHILVMDNGRLK